MACWDSVWLFGVRRLFPIDLVIHTHTQMKDIQVITLAIVPFGKQSSGVFEMTSGHTHVLCGEHNVIWRMSLPSF